MGDRQILAKAREAFVGDGMDRLAAAERQIDDLTEQLKKADYTVASMTLR